MVDSRLPRPRAVGVPKVLYILSVGHSGSTLLDIMLGAHPRGVSLGELTFKGPYLNVDSTCSCSVGPLLSCPHWKAINKRLGAKSAGLEELPLAGPGTEVNNQQFYESVCEANAADFVVESSKSVARLRDLARCDNLDLYVILLTRNPAAVVASHVRRGRSFVRYLTAYLINVPSQEQLARQWKGPTVTYEDLVMHPDVTVERIYREANIKGEWRVECLQDQQYHLSGGNPIRFKRRHDLQADERWKSELSLVQRLMIVSIINGLSLRAMTFMFNVVRQVRSRGLTMIAQNRVKTSSQEQRR